MEAHRAPHEYDAEFRKATGRAPTQADLLRLGKKWVPGVIGSSDDPNENHVAALVKTYQDMFPKEMSAFSDDEIRQSIRDLGQTIKDEETRALVAQHEQQERRHERIANLAKTTAWGLLLGVSIGTGVGAFDAMRTHDMKQTVAKYERQAAAAIKQRDEAFTALERIKADPTARALKPTNPSNYTAQEAIACINDGLDKIAAAPLTFRSLLDANDAIYKATEGKNQVLLSRSTTPYPTRIVLLRMNEGKIAEFHRYHEGHCGGFWGGTCSGAPMLENTKPLLSVIFDGDNCTTSVDGHYWTSSKMGTPPLEGIDLRYDTYTKQALDDIITRMRSDTVQK